MFDMLNTLPSVTHWHKHEITHRNVTFGNVYGMTTTEFRERWRSQSDMAARLKWARMYWQDRAGAVNGSAKDAADSIGMEPGTYRAYERDPSSSKHTRMDHQTAIRFGRKFQVYWVWLLLGEGTPFDNELPPAQERVVRAMSDASEDQQTQIADMIEAFFRARLAG